MGGKKITNHDPFEFEMNEGSIWSLFSGARKIKLGNIYKFLT